MTMYRRDPGPSVRVQYIHLGKELWVVKIDGAGWRWGRLAGYPVGFHGWSSLDSSLGRWHHETYSTLYGATMAARSGKTLREWP